MDPSAKQRTPSKRARYVTLDGMRGIAAVGVALRHLDPAMAPGGHLAVDFFFVLSGFVLARTYGDRFANGMGLREFAWVRFVRLYPLFLVGILVGAIFAVQGIIRNSDHHLALGQFVPAFLLNVAMLPAPFETPYPLNLPAWSLLLELLANVLLVTMLWRLPTKALGGLAGLAGILLVVFAASKDSLDYGSYWSAFHFAVLRTLFSFTTGVLLARTAQGHERPARWATAVLFVLLAAAVFWPIGKHRVALELMAVFGIFPMLVFIGSRYEPSRRLAPFAALFGEVSYALYVVNMPIAHGFQFVARQLGVSPATVAPMYLATVLVAAWIATRWVDLPLRARLARLRG